MKSHFRTIRPMVTYKAKIIEFSRQKCCKNTFASWPPSVAFTGRPPMVARFARNKVNSAAKNHKFFF